jgi:hypothetical protein
LGRSPTAWRGFVWKILHDGVSYLEQGQDTDPRAKKRRAQKLAQALRKLGFSVTLTELNPGTVPAGQRVIFNMVNPRPDPGGEIFNGASFYREIF